MPASVAGHVRIWPRGSRRVLRKIHRWVGLFLMLPLVLQGLTGTLLIVIPLLLPGPPHISDTGPQAGAEAIIAASRASAPPDMIPLRYNPAAHPGDSALVTYGPPGERHPTSEVFVNPVHPAVIGTYVIPSWLRFLHNLHADLFLLPYGQSATGMMGLLLGGMAVTGLILWWRPGIALWKAGKWRRAILISPRARGLRLWREAHVTIGFWLSFMLLFLALSGSVLAFPFSRPLFGVHRPAPTGHHGHHMDGARSEHEPGEQGLDAALAALKARMPEARLQSVQLGARPDQQSFDVVLPAYGANHPATVQYDPQTDILRISRDPGQQRAGERSFQWLHTLHEARLASPAPVALVWKGAVLVTGMGLVFFSISGVVMWTLRRRATAHRAAQRGDSGMTPSSPRV
ncbi:PepSY-associated TM helix domain-containing protein [Novacetimonas pomaceti]|uniref:Peptidase n=1 Tax=Novacetimonas pomaceti TaxID=2021998 RepID=A0ABX5P371_9PROT|nr:PepSY-associated TM helix domain-containing protein [Novacetimonas pomaceti]PYD48219.1 peptidase [Novacetimonas pomaceti]